MFESRWRAEHKPAKEESKSNPKPKKTKPKKPVVTGLRIMGLKTGRKLRGERSLLWTQIVVGILLAITVGLMVAGIYYGTRQPAFQVTAITISGGYTIPHTAVRQIVEQHLAGTYVRLIPHRFVFLYPKHAIYNDLMKIPRIKDVQIRAANHHTVAVTFDEYRPYALWCASATSTDCDFIDKNGYAFAPAPDLTGNAFVRYTTVGTSTASTTDRQVIEPAELHMIMAFSDLVETGLNLYVTMVALEPNGDVYYTVSGGGVLKVAGDMPVMKTYSNLKTILITHSFQHLEDGDFQYIDLRFGDKVYVNDTVPTTTASTTANS